MCRLMIRGGRNREEIKGVVIFSINTLIGFISSRPADHIALILMITGRGPSPGDKKKKEEEMCTLEKRRVGVVLLDHTSDPAGGQIIVGSISSCQMDRRVSR